MTPKKESQDIFDVIREVAMSQGGTSQQIKAAPEQVVKKGFVTNESALEVAPGQTAKLRAKLVAETDPITKKGWFWGGAAAVVAGGVTAAYFLTRPEPQPPDYQGGSLDWVALPR